MINFNNFGTCEKNTFGTGKGSCPIGILGDLQGLSVINKGTTLSTTADGFNETVFRNFITTGKLHQLNNLDGFEDATPENERYTSPQGFMNTVREGKPMYNINFRKGFCFDRALQSLKGQDRWDVILYFKSGILVCTDAQGTKLKGLNLGMFDANPFKFLSGTDSEFSRIALQFNDVIEFTEKWVFIPYDILGFEPLKIESSIETIINFSTPPVAGSEIVVAIVDACNSSVNYTDLIDNVTDYTVLVNGIENVVTAVSIASGVATLTLNTALVSTDIVKVYLKDVVADAELKYYKSNTATATV